MNKTMTFPGLYVHIPFCHSKCHYCDFYSRPLRDFAIVENYIKALCRELEMRVGKSTASWRTVYIGGGTPSILASDAFETLIGGFGPVDGVKEFTIEVNPEDVEPNRLAHMKSLGVTRVSMGVQSFSDSYLKKIGRRHSAERALEAIGYLAESGMDYSIDLIYGLPGQTMAEWENELEMAMKTGASHLSAYLLTYEPGTRMDALLKKGVYSEVPEPLAVEMYEVLCTFTRECGYRHYEISNFSLLGKEAVHNSSYWDGTPYIGIGPGAHSFDGYARYFNPADLKMYMKKIACGILPLQTEPETEEEQLNDLLITALRTAQGLEMKRLSVFSRSVRNRAMINIERQLGEGRLKRSEDGRIYISELDWIVSDAILRDLIIDC